MALPVRTTDGGGVAVTGPVQAGKGLRVLEGGAAAVMGTATLAGSTVTVATTAVTATSRIFLTAYGTAGGGPTGAMRVSARTPGTSFVITSSVAAEAGTVAWMIVEPGTAGL